MAKILNLDDMLDVLRNANHPGLEGFEREAVALATRVGAVVGAHFGIRVSHASAECVGMGGTSCAMAPAFEGQKWPEDLIEYDVFGEFAAE
jgi:hypothetical protein